MRKGCCGKVIAEGSLFNASKSHEKFMKSHNEDTWLLDEEAHVHNERMWVLKGYDCEKAQDSRMKRCIWWKGMTVKEEMRLLKRHTYWKCVLVNRHNEQSGKDVIIERSMISVKRHVGSYGYDEYICAYFDLLKSIFAIQIHVDRDQRSDEKPVTKLRT